MIITGLIQLFELLFDLFFLIAKTSVFSFKMDGTQLPFFSELYNFRPRKEVEVNLRFELCC